MYSEPHPLLDCRKRSPGTQQQKSLSHTATPSTFVPWSRTRSGCPRASQSTHLMVNWVWYTPCNPLGPVFPHTPDTHKETIGLQPIQHTAHPNAAARHISRGSQILQDAHTNARGLQHTATCKEGMRHSRCSAVLLLACCPKEASRRGSSTSRGRSSLSASHGAKGCSAVLQHRTSHSSPPAHPHARATCTCACSKAACAVEVRTKLGEGSSNAAPSMLHVAPHRSEGEGTHWLAAAPSSIATRRLSGGKEARGGGHTKPCSETKCCAVLPTVGGARDLGGRPRGAGSGNTRDGSKNVTSIGSVTSSIMVRVHFIKQMKETSSTLVRSFFQRLGNPLLHPVAASQLLCPLRSRRSRALVVAVAQCGGPGLMDRLGADAGALAGGRGEVVLRVTLLAHRFELHCGSMAPIVNAIAMAAGDKTSSANIPSSNVPE